LRPSENVFTLEKLLMKLYRYLTGPDDASFCRRVTEALQNGWELYGNPTLTFDGEHIICGQAVVKESNGGYDPEKPLSEY
jgi:hypothetical protein